MTNTGLLITSSKLMLWEHGAAVPIGRVVGFSGAGHWNGSHTISW